MAKAKRLAEAEQASTNIWSKNTPSKPVELGNLSRPVANTMRRITTDTNIVFKRLS